MNSRILIVDDDKSVLNVLYKSVKSNGFDADLVMSGEEALNKLYENRYSLLLLDINMPGINGFEVIRKIRADGLNLPIMIISARTSDDDTLYGLQIGADDYITKPFNPVTLGAKVKALIRRSSSTSGSEIITAGPFSYNSSTLRFFKNGEEIPLSSKENAILKMFIDNIDRVFSKDVIYSSIWGNAIIDENAIMVYINRLRQKIEDNPSEPRHLLTVRGLGYRFTV